MARVEAEKLLVGAKGDSVRVESEAVHQRTVLQVHHNGTNTAVHRNGQVLLPRRYKAHLQGVEIVSNRISNLTSCQPHRVISD